MGKRGVQRRQLTLPHPFPRCALRGPPPRSLAALGGSAAALHEQLALAVHQRQHIGAPL